MEPTIEDTPTVPDHLLALLHSHLPHSLALLRRLQFARRVPGGLTPTSHILFAHYGQGQSPVGTSTSFAAAYVDLSRGPETEAWLYSSALEGGGSRSAESLAGEKEKAGADVLVLALLRRVRRLEDEFPPSGRGTPGLFILGAVNEAVRGRLLTAGVRMTPTANVPADEGWEFCGKWLFRPEKLPDPDTTTTAAVLSGGMRWDTIRRGDVALVQSRTVIKRQAATLLMLPSLVLRLEDDTPIAWAFLGLDGTLMTLHCEEPYRGRGLAKMLASRLMRDHLKEYGEDGLGAADVYVGNEKSQRVCKSIGGELIATVSWAMIDLASVGEPL